MSKSAQRTAIPVQVTALWERQPNGGWYLLSVFSDPTTCPKLEAGDVVTSHEIFIEQPGDGEQQ